MILIGTILAGLLGLGLHTQTARVEIETTQDTCEPAAVVVPVVQAEIDSSAETADSDCAV